MLKSSSRIVPCLLLAACGAAESPEGATIDPDAEARRNMIIDASSLTGRELVEEMDRRLRLAREEMGSIHEPTVRAQVEREVFQIQIVEFENDGIVSAEPGGTYLMDARRLDNGSPIRVHVREEVSLSIGDVLEVVVGQHGYYFQRIVVEDRP
jgi:hypothetical protein